MSKSKSETARANGAKSRGPVTPEGRAKSSANSRSHGLTANYALLPQESQQEFDLLRDGYINQFHPASDVEMEFVEVMVIACWRLRRLFAIESNLLDIEITRQREDLDEEFEDLSEPARLASAFQKLSDQGHSVALIIRYEGALNRSYDKAFKRLLELQSDHQSPAPPSTNIKMRNEPTVPPDLALDASAPPRQPECSEGSAFHQPLRDASQQNRDRKGADAEHIFMAVSEARPLGSAFRVRTTPLRQATTMIKPTAQIMPLQPLKPAFDVNPTILVRDSVS